MAAKKVLITGANGFIGKNLVAELSREPEQYELLLADLDTPAEQLLDYLRVCEFVVHLAGVNRPKDESEFARGNAGLTAYILETLQDFRNAAPVAMTSSTQAALDNPYGKSKLEAEQEVLAYGQASHTPVYAFRLPNVFGKWGRPNYNSAVATFCYNIARGLPVSISDPHNELTLVYIDDVLALLKGAIAGEITPQPDGYCAVPVTHKATLGYIVDKLNAYRDARTTLAMPAFASAFDKALYSTYLSYLEPGAFSYVLTKHSDARGAFAEFFKTDAQGQFSVSTTEPGITRGNHWHHTKVEKFLVVSGQADIRFRKVDGGEIVTYAVCADDMMVVDIPPGYTHSITNTSQTQTLVTLIWANEPFDPKRPDTNFLEV